MVKELIDLNGRLFIVGGVIKKNNKFFEINIYLFVNKVYGGNLDVLIDLFLINKEEVLLKEFDFKIR